MMRLSLQWEWWITSAALAVCLLFAHTTDALNQQQLQQQLGHGPTSTLTDIARCKDEHFFPGQGQQPSLVSATINNSLPQIETDTTSKKQQSGRQRDLCHGHLQSHNHHSSHPCRSQRQHRQQQNAIARGMQHTTTRQQKWLQTHTLRSTYPSSRHSKRHTTKPKHHHKCTSSHNRHNTRSKHQGHKEQARCAKDHQDREKKTRLRSFRKSTFHKYGRMYMLNHQNWYTQYRRQRGPRGMMRKLTLENARRRKAMITFLPSSYSGINNRLGSDSGGHGSHGFNNGTGSVEDGFDDNPKGINPEGDAGGEGEDANGNNSDLQGAGDDPLDRATGTIQAVKRPTVKGIPEPISYQHRGIIPKSRSEGARLSPWQELAIATAVISLVVTHQ